MIPVSRLNVIIGAGYLAAYDLASDLLAELPRDGVVLSGDEVARIREALHGLTDGVEKWDALSLLDSAGED